MDVNQIYHGDCLDLIRQLPDDMFQVTFADPPFNLDKKYNSPFRDLSAQDAYLEWCKQWITEMVRVTRPDGSIFIHHIPRQLIYFAHHLDTAAQFKNWIAWDAPAGPM